MPLNAPAASTRIAITPIVGGFGVGQKIAEIMRRIARRHRRPGARVQHVVADLGGVEGAGVGDPVQRRGVADRGDAEKARLALLAQPLERRHDLAEHDFRRQVRIAAVGEDVVVQLEQVDMVELQPL